MERARMATSREDPRGLPLVVILAAVPLLLLFLARSHVGIDLSDEGFLWYGASAVLRGEVPMRDFQSYDPARYYWCAAWMSFLGDGLVPLRVAVTAFQFLGVLAGLLTFRRVTRSPLALGALSILLALWMLPRYQFTQTVSLAGVWIAVMLIERPTTGRHFLAGVYVGVAAFFGRNLGVYALAAVVLVILLVWFRAERGRLAARLAACAAGVIVGYLPMLAMIAFVPGFLASQVDWFIYITSLGGANLKRGVPWPWEATGFQMFLLGLAFLLMPLFSAAATLWIARRSDGELRRAGVLAAATAFSLPYLHYMFSRPDAQHLGMSIHPFLIGLSAAAVLSSRWWRRGIAAVIAALVLLAFLGSGLLTRFMTPESQWHRVQVGDAVISMREQEARWIDAARRAEARVTPGRGLLAIPSFPGVYPLLGRPSPTWQIYFIVPEPETSQKRMIEQMQRNEVEFILFANMGADNRVDLRFPKTHPLVWRFIRQHFAPVRFELPQNFHLLRRRSSRPSREVAAIDRERDTGRSITV